MKIMNQFMEPRSVALVGVSRYTGEGAFNILENLLSYGYQGKIYPINPSVSEILGVKTYSSVAETADDIDLAVIATPRALVPQLVKECAASNIKAIEIVAQGFSDAGDEEGKQLQKEIDNIAKGGQARILGPNTFGTANAFVNFSSTFIKIKMKKQPIGVICQTGAFFVGFSEMAFVGKGIDLGNACDVSFSEGLEYFENDSDTKVVALHIEGMQDTKAFASISRDIARKKPILALKTGQSEQAAKAVQSHTGSLTGRKEVWQAAFKQAGIIQVSDLEELIDLAKTFSVLPLMKKSKIGVATISGALGVMAIDASQNFDIGIDTLSPKTQKLLDTMAPSWLKVSNPVDIWPIMITSQPITKLLIDGLEALLADHELGAVLFIGAAFDEKWGTGLCQLLSELAAAHQDKPLTCCIYGPSAEQAIKEMQDTGKVVGFHTPERAIKALARLNEYSRLRSGL
ncbi:MAG: CoA-binding protein [Chloroflexi bacterium]|nr:CoA-binding protein [Chloroflexota bacterium]